MSRTGRPKGSSDKLPRKPNLDVGKRYGIWTILEYEGSRSRYPPDSRHDQFWKSQCSDCGRIESRTTTQIHRSPNSCRCHLVTADASYHRAFRTYKRQAKTRSLNFELTLQDFKNLVSQNCAYCGHHPELNSYSSDSKIRIPMNGIDRKDSSLGYSIENCIPCCGTCNLAKLDYPHDFFLKWADRVAKFQFRKLLFSVSNLPGVCKEGIPKPDEDLESEDGE